MKREALRFLRFAADRLPYVWAFAAAVFCAAAEAALAGGRPGFGEFGYMLLLTLFFLLAALAFDYAKRAPFLRRAEELLEMPELPLDEVLALRGGGALEPEACVRLLHALRMAYADRLDGYRRQQERRRLFTSRWVHQMKTPVSVIELIAQQADRLRSLTEAQDALQSVREENERIAQGLETALYEARLDKFESDARLERLPLARLVRDAVNRHKQALIRASVFPQIAGDETAEAETDAKWLSFILGQLISNAIKYSGDKPGSKKLVFRIESDAKGCELLVADEGVGIPEADLPRVTEPFFTGENGRRTGESTGMGLYLVREACRMLGHTLRIESAPGRGTTVAIGFAGDHLYKLNADRPT